MKKQILEILGVAFLKSIVKMGEILTKGLTYEQFAPLVGLTPNGFKSAMKTRKLSAQTIRCIELLRENEELKERLSALDSLKKALQLV